MIYLSRLVLILILPLTIVAFMLACILSIADKDSDFTVWEEIVYTHNFFKKSHADIWFDGNWG